MNLDDPIALALLTAERLETAGIPHALYGGLALAAYGRPRETKDADLAVLDAEPTVAKVALEQAGLTATVPFERMRFGGLFITRLTVVGEGATTGLNTVDLVQPLSARFAREVLERAIVAPLRGQAIRVVCPEDFVLLKVLSTRDGDVADAATVIQRSPSIVDETLLEKELHLLEKEISEHDVRARWEAVRNARRLL